MPSKLLTLPVPVWFLVFGISQTPRPTSPILAPSPIGFAHAPHPASPSLTLSPVRAQAQPLTKKKEYHHIQ